MNPPQYDAFISYSHHDKDWVWEWLVPRLKAAGLSLCTDRESFDVGVPSLINMENAVANSAHTVLVMTPAWIASEWTGYESLLVQTKDPMGMRQRTLPVMREMCEPPDRIAMLTYADLRDGNHQASEFDKLAAAIRGQRLGPPHAPRTTQYASRFTIPAPVADFTGRAAELDALVAHLSADGGSAHIAGLRGMGGVGKTQLAYAAAARLRAQYSDAALLVSMQAGDEPITPEAALTRALLALFPTATLPDALADLQALYCDNLAGTRGVLLLDNALNAAQVAPLLPPPAGWAAIVTSRERFGLKDAPKLVNLDVLPEGEAADLLRTMLEHGGRSDLAADAAGLADLAKLCGRLPLALRVAAGYLCSYPDETLASYCEALKTEGKRLAVLSAPGEEDVSAVLGLSARRLERDDAALAARWRELAVFPAPFDRAAAAAVWGELVESSDGVEASAGHSRQATNRLKPPVQPVLIPLDAEETAAGLRELARRSLLDADAAAGTYALHDLLREVAVLTYPPNPPPEAGGGSKQTPHSLVGKGAGGLGPTPAQMRHAWHYLEAGAAADVLHRSKDGALAGLQAFDAAWPHLRVAWERLRGRAEPAAQRWRSYLPGRTAFVLELRTTPRTRIPLLEDALAAARALDYKEAEGVYLGSLGLAYADLGDARRAIGYYEQALVIDREIGDRRGEGNALGNLGIAYKNLGEARRAIGYYEQALVIDREIGDRRGEGADLGNLGLAYAALGEARRAIGYYEQTLEIHREIGDRRGEGADLGNLGLAYAALGEARRAIEYYEQQLVIVREIGDRRGEGAALGNLGNAYADLGDARQAIGYYEQQLVIVREIGDRRGEANASWNLGLVYESQDDYARAAALMQVCVDFEREAGHADAEADAAYLEEVRRRGASAGPSTNR